MGTALVVAAYLALLMLVAWFYFRSRSKVREAGTAESDRVSTDLVSGLMVELRKAQAETAYWRAAAERLQHEVDER